MFHFIRTFLGKRLIIIWMGNTNSSSPQMKGLLFENIFCLIFFQFFSKKKCLNLNKWNIKYTNIGCKWWVMRMGNCCRPGWWHLQLPSPKTWGSLLFWDVKKYLIDDKKMTNFGALFIKRREVRGWQKNVSKYLFLFTLFKNTHTRFLFLHTYFGYICDSKKRRNCSLKKCERTITNTYATHI